MTSTPLARRLRSLVTAMAVGTAALYSSQASAVQYESEIDISSEQDLYDLQLEGDISEETLETLLALFQSGVDLNTASPEEIYELPNLTYEHVNAIIAYRKSAHGIEKPESLVAAGVVDEKLLLQILPFISLSDVSKGTKKYVGGNVKYGIAASTSDTKAPPMFARLRLKAPFNLQGGLLLMTTRNMIDKVYSEDGKLWADRPGYALHVPKYYVQWKNSNFKVIAGTFRIGFGERLTLDNTTKSTPNGFYADDVYNTPQDLATACKESKGDSSGSEVLCDGVQGVETGDYTWSHGFRGVAASGKLELPDVELNGTVFISYEDKSIYQYELYNTEECVDPHSSSKDCKTPPIYVGLDEEDPLFGVKHSYRTLPSMFRELAGGGNATIKIGHTGFVGLTGYGAKSTFDDLGKEYKLDFQEWSRIPYGGPYGAIGINGGVYLNKVSLFAEFARSFDSMPDGEGGGYGVVQRTVYNPSKKQELELTIRYYDRDFANPYSRATAAADEYDGNRGRNEFGIRLRYYGRLPDWIFSGQADWWMWPHDALTYDSEKAATVVDNSMPKGTNHLQLKTRAQFVGFDLVQPWLSFEYRNRDLGFNDNSYENSKGELVGSCYDSGSEYVKLGEDADASVKCRGQFYRAGIGTKIEPLRKQLWFDLRYQHEFLNDKKYVDELRQDMIFSLGATYKPIPELNIRARFRYLFEDIKDNESKEQSIWAYLAVGYRLMKLYTFNLRYDFYHYLDDRKATIEKDNRSQHRLRFDFEAKF